MLASEFLGFKRIWGRTHKHVYVHTLQVNLEGTFSLKFMSHTRWADDQH